MNKSELGPLGIKLLAYVQNTSQDIIRTGDLQHRLKISATQENNLLRRLTNHGFILRLKKGLYLAPKKIPATGNWQPNEYYIIARYMEILKADYYIGGATAIHYHGLSTQIPQIFTVYNTKLSTSKKIKNLNISFIKISQKRIGGIESLKIPHANININIANIARTIMDSINDWTRYNTLPKAYEWIKKRCHDQTVTNKLIQLTSKHANKNTLRRIGYILECCGISSTTLKPLTKKLRIYT